VHLLKPVSAASVANAIGAPLRGSAAEVHGISPLKDAAPGLLIFDGRESGEGLPAGAIVVARREPGEATWIVSERPRLAFAKAIAWLDAHVGFQLARETNIHATASVASTASIADGVTIGARTVVGHHVRIASGVTIGEDCVIKSGAVIGEDGFGFERDLDGTPIRLIHFGGARIGHRVEVGSLATICQGTLSPTIIEDDVKLDDHVHVAHNVRIGQKTLVTACAELSGSVTVGQRVWIGPNASCMNGITIGDDAFIGLGAIVLNDVAANTTIYGVPGRVLPQRQ
jgi:UDP-3-O-[3-hydroxymyristoyl] glucosamine N-acyltransferase